MYRYKILTPDVDGKLAFTPQELEKLLTDAYEDGVRDGVKMRDMTPYPRTPDFPPYYPEVL